MDLLESNASRLRFEAYIEQLANVIGHADRMVPLHDYCTGLLLPGERKSVEPMAALTAPARTAAKHQSLLHFVAIAPWSDEAVLTKVRQMALPKIEALGAIEASIIDDTGFPKKGKHSVGVARQYCGQLGKQDNCQAVVSLSIANHHASLPIAHRLYLPQSWADDPDRRKTAKVPEDLVFRTKPQIALEQLTNHQGIDDLVRHVRGRLGGRGGNGFQLAIILTQRLAAALSVIPGKCRRSSIAADNSPLSLNTRRIASAVASSTLNIAQVWAAHPQRTRRRPTMSAGEQDPGRGLKSCRGHSPIRGASPGWRYREHPPRWHLEDGISSNPAQRMARCPSILPKHKSITERLSYHLPSRGQFLRNRSRTFRPTEDGES